MAMDTLLARLISSLTPEELVEVKGLIEARLERPKILTPTIVAVAPDATQLEVVKAVRMITGQRLTEAKLLVEQVLKGSPLPLPGVDATDLQWLKKLGCVIEYRES